MEVEDNNDAVENDSKGAEMLKQTRFMLSHSPELSFSLVFKQNTIDWRCQTIRHLKENNALVTLVKSPDSESPCIKPSLYRYTQTLVLSKR